MFSEQNSFAISPVIGVILMVAVTVALVPLVTVTVFDLGGDVSDSPDATVQLEADGGNVQATLLRNKNVDKLYLKQGSASWVMMITIRMGIVTKILVVVEVHHSMGHQWRVLEIQ